MRVMSNFKAVGWMAMAALILPVQPAQASEVSPPAAACVQFEGLNHCPIGGASLFLGGDGLTVSGFGRGGGVYISLGLAASWDASVVYRNSYSTRQEAVYTAISEGQPTSTATVGLQGTRRDIAATFTGAGANSTYSVFVYREGVFQGGLGGVPSGGVAARQVGGGAPPECKSPWVPTNDCLNDCAAMKYTSCNYCYVNCPEEVREDTNFHRAVRGPCVWELGTSGPRRWELANGVQVEGDRVVLTEEVGEAGSYPYLSFDAIILQGTTDSVTLVHESVVKP